MNNENEKIIERLKFPVGKIRVVIDSDAYNEVDDQFAIAWALKSPERMSVEAVYAAPFSHGCFGKVDMSENSNLKGMMSQMVNHASSAKDGMEQSYAEILNLYKLLGKDSKGRVFKGSDKYIDKSRKPIESEAACDLVKRAMESDETLYVIAIGAITNIASAILIEPKIVDKIVVVWLGGQPLDFPHNIEFNLMQDVEAINIVLDSKVPFVLIPCMAVASSLTTTSAELNVKLHGKSKVGTYLSDIVTSKLDNDAAIPYAGIMYKSAYLKGLDDTADDIAAKFETKHMAWSRIVWDISAVGFLMNPNWCFSTITSAPNVSDDLKWVRSENRHPIRICNFVSRDQIFGEMFSKLTD